MILDKYVSLKIRAHVLGSDEYPKFRVISSFARLYLKTYHSKLLEKYDGLCDVVTFMYEIVCIERSWKSPPIPIFFETNIKTLQEYVNLLEKGNHKIKKHYKAMAEVNENSFYRPRNKPDQS